MFRDRRDAGARLAERLAGMELGDPVVLALPRGGVPVAAEVARRLGAPLDLLIVRKIGVPGQEELAAGAVADGEPAEVVWNADVLAALRLQPDDFADALAARRAEIADRRARYLAGRAPVLLAGRTVVVVDDGIATGATVKAALACLAQRRPARIVLAVPVAPGSVLAEMRTLTDEVLCLEMPEPFRAVGSHYADFTQTSDAEVTRLLAAADGA